MTDSNSQDQTTADAMRADLLTPQQQQKYMQAILAITADMTKFTFVGDAAEVSMQIAQYNFNRGLLHAFTELMNDHSAAVGTLTAPQETGIQG